MVKRFPTFFIKDKGRIRIWTARVQVDVTEFGTMIAIIKVMHGLHKGKIQTKRRVVDVGKNIGKSNETTPIDQATSEVESMVDTQRNNGYRSFEDMGIDIQDVDEHTRGVYGFENGKQYINTKTGEIMCKAKATTWLINNLPETVVDAVGREKAMKYHVARLPEYLQGSKEYKKARRVAFPVYVQPKLDGVNCVATPLGLYSRQGKDSLTKGGKPWKEICPQIHQAVKALNYPFALNGEVYKYPENLRTVTDACRKENPLSSALELHIFDYIDTEKTYEYRMGQLLYIQDMIYAMGLDDVLKIIPNTYCENWDGVNEVEHRWLERGEEGVMLKELTAMYLPGKRTSNMLKLVRMDLSTVQIVDIIPMEKEPTQGLFVCRVPGMKEKTFNVTPSEFTHVQRQAFLSNKSDYVGKLLTIQHRGYTVYGVPRIAVAKLIK